MKKTGVFFITIILLFSFCSCRGDVPSAYDRIKAVNEKYRDLLGAVSLYSSCAEEGSEEYTDEGLIAVMLGDGEYPQRMSGCAEYAFLCASDISLHEVWVVECRTYSSARDVYELFEKRKKLLTSPQYESEQDEAAAEGAVLVRDGKFVYFAVCERGEEIVNYLLQGK